MELGSVANLASRLLEALEKSGISSGAELRSDFGPSGQPDPELVRAFEEALAGGPAPAASDPSSTIDTMHFDSGGLEHQPPEAPGAIPDQTDSLGVDGLHDFGPREFAPSGPTAVPDQLPRDLATPAPESPATDRLRELNGILDRMESGQLRAEDLFRMQYLIGMLKVNAESGMQASKKTAQTFDNLLKQKG
ncbi:MAG: hypothetical protein EOL86_07860 [Deltaproteobacteria bacterium]|nr:hypothetical protein [Deltaproteobacteria bacterium]